MKRNKFYLLGSKCVAFAFGVLTFASCVSDGDDTIVLENGTIDEVSEGEQTTVVSTDESKTLTKDGFTLTVPYGAVPQNNAGTNGKVAFSMSHPDNLPAPIPEGYTMVTGGDMKIEPMNFTFESPLTLDVSTHGYNPSELALLRYNENTGMWEIVPFSSVDSDYVSVSILELGYFVLVRKSDMQLGGVHISKRYLDEDYYYYLTLTPIGSGSNTTKSISFASNGHDLYMANIPLGNYTVTVSRELRNSLSNASERVESYSTSVNASVDTRLVAGNGGYNTYTGWTEIELGNSWRTGRPSVWGETTVTYGTGKFQATLTWVNTSSSATDYDLHLYGPSDMHVFYSNKHSTSFELDRDWLTETGNAIENIYSINDSFTPGTYYVKVHHFSGMTGKRYNCRVIVDGVVDKSVSGTINTNKLFDDIYTFTVQ